VIILAANDLETPETEDENGEDRHDDVLDDGEAERREFFVAVEHGACQLPRLEGCKCFGQGLT